MKIKALKTKAALLLASFFASPVFAASGGLAKATAVASDIKVEMYAFLGVGAFLYMMYLVIWAKMGRKQWSDVLEGLGHVACAGGILAAVTWAWNIWA